MLTKLKGLSPGDLVRAVAPAGKGCLENLPRVKAYVESLGLTIKIREDIYGDNPFYSNDDEIRAEDFLDALLDDNCKVIWCIRGGSGCLRLINYLESQLPSTPPTPKILIGYSDITILHLYLQNKYNWKSIHGPMLESLANGFHSPDEECVIALRDLLFNRASRICEPLMIRLDTKGPITSINTEVVGGNLTLVGMSVATIFEVNCLGKILFLEDVGEDAYALERSLDHLKQAGIFDGVAAVVFGDFSDPDSETLLNLALQRFADDQTVPCPVFKLTGIGHEKVNFPLPLNTNAEIIMDNFDKKTYRFCVDNLPDS